MHIKITTTEKKISKSIISQMKSAHLPALQNGKALGYVVNVVKDVGISFIIEWNDDYYTIAGNWKKSTAHVYRKARRGVSEKRFENKATLEIWWEAYQRILKADTHIYI